MPQYSYRAKDRTLNVVEGTIEAESETAAIHRLGSLGVYPITIDEVVIGASRRALATPRRIPAVALAHMSRQLADLLSGGLSLLNALTLLSQQTEHRVLRQIIYDMSLAVREGQSFSQALASHPQVFSPLYVNMVKAGEVSGALDTVLVRLADLAEAESEFRQHLLGALVYPLVVLAIGVLTIAVLLTYVIPKLTVLFVETGQLLPLPTRILLAVSGTLTRYWWVLLVGTLLGGWLLNQWRRSSSGRRVLDTMVWQLPLASSFARKIDLARFGRNLGVMLGQGVPMLQALEVVKQTLSNSLMRDAMGRIHDAVRDGSSLAHACTASGMIPLLMSNMIAVGEESGTLETALAKVGSSYEREVDRAARTLTTLLEPLLIVVVGVIVMFIVISMLLPIFQIGLVAQ